MKKILKVFLIVMLVSLLFVGCTKTETDKDDGISNGNTVEYDKELMQNGDFEAGLGVAWTTKDSTDGYIDAAVRDSNKEDDNYNEIFGERYLEVSNLWSPGYYNLSQTVKLQKGVTYRLAIHINVVNIPEGVAGKSYLAAFVGFSDDSVIARIDSKKKTDGFTLYEIYFTPRKTGNQKIIIGNGAADLLVLANVQFDNVSVKAVKDVPAGFDTINIGVGLFDTFNQTAEGVLFVTLLTLLAILVMVGGYYAVKKTMTSSNEELGTKLFKNVKARKFFTSPYTLSIVAILAAFIVRFILVNTVAGFSVELNSFSNWASSMVNKGLNQFYESYKVAPVFGGQLYILSFVGLIAKLFSVPFGSLGFFVLMKIPAIIADLIIVFIIFELVMQNPKFNKLSAFFISLTYALMPIVFTISSAWGQFTSVGLLFILLAVLSIVKYSKEKKSIVNHPIATIAYLALAIFFEPMMALVIPMFIGYFFIKGITTQNWKLLVQVTSAVLGAFVIYFLVMLPFTIDQVAKGDVFFFVKKLALACTKGGIATNDTFNFIALFGNNNVVAGVASIVMNYIVVIAISGLCLYSYYVSKNRLDFLLHIAMIFMINSVFGLYVNVYYSLISIALMFVYFAMTGETRVFASTMMFGFTSIINAGLLMNYCGYIGSGALAKYIPFANGSALIIIFSIINILFACYFMYVVYDITFKKRRICIDPNVSFWKDLRFTMKKNAVKNK